MKSFRSIAYALAGVLSACFGIASCLLEPLVHLVVHRVKDLECGVQKLKRELVHNFTDAPMAMTGFGCGLTPEGHGFRQTSASDLGAQRTPLSI
jgi:hypothetical protein